MRRTTGYPGSSTTTTTTTLTTFRSESLFMILRVPTPAQLQSTRNEMQTFVESSEGSELGSIPLFPGGEETTTVRQAIGMMRTDVAFQAVTGAILTDPAVIGAVMNNPQVQEFLCAEEAAAQAGSSTSATQEPAKRASVWSRIRGFLVRAGRTIWAAIRDIVDSFLKGFSKLVRSKFLKAYGISILTLFTGLANQLFG